MKIVLASLKIILLSISIFSSLCVAAPSLDGDWYFQSGEIDGQLLGSAMDLETVPDETWPIFKVNGESLSIPMASASMTDEGIKTTYTYLTGKYLIANGQLIFSFIFENKNTEISLKFELLSKDEMKVTGFLDENLVMILMRN